MKKRLNLFTLYLVLTALLVVTACSSGESENKAPVAEERLQNNPRGMKKKSQNKKHLFLMG